MAKDERSSLEFDSQSTNFCTADGNAMEYFFASDARYFYTSHYQLGSLFK